MSMSLEYLIDWEYIPFYPKDQCLKMAENFLEPERAKAYILENYDRVRKQFETNLGSTEKIFKSSVKNPNHKQ